MIRFLLIRHALTDTTGKNLSGRAPGISLNAEGRKQAVALSERLSGLPITAIYSSPLARALETANPAVAALGIQCEISAAFLEIDFGEWTGRSIQELKDDPAFNRFNSARSMTRIPGGELMMEAQMRIVAGLERLKNDHPGQMVAVVSHGDMIKSAIAWYAGIHLDLFHRLEISPASVSVLELWDDAATIVMVNDQGGLGKIAWK